MHWLFLQQQEQTQQVLRSSTFYDFVPHQERPHSFQTCRDIDGLQDAGLLDQGSTLHCSISLCPTESYD